jgi:hypothetical protein
VNDQDWDDEDWHWDRWKPAALLLGLALWLVVIWWLGNR